MTNKSLTESDVMLIREALSLQAKKYWNSADEYEGAYYEVAADDNYPNSIRIDMIVQNLKDRAIRCSELCDIISDLYKEEQQ